MSYDRTNTGTLAKNTRKETEKHPDITGSINVEGREYYLNGWQKTNRTDGSTFYSLSVKPKEARQEAPQTPSYGADKSRRQVPPSFNTDADDIPFAPSF